MSVWPLKFVAELSSCCRKFSAGIFEKLAMAEANPPRFDGTNYSLWALRMKFHMKGLHLWNHTQGEVVVPELGGNPSIAAMKRHEDMMARANRAVSTLHSAMSDAILTRFVSCETAKQI